MDDVQQRLTDLSNEISRGVMPASVRVRGFLRWFGAERRGYLVVKRIRASLERHQLETQPDFEYAYIDGDISFVRSGQSSPKQEDATYRIGRFESANTAPVSVKPDQTVAEATTLMFTHDYSQLPVMTGQRDIKGGISWKSIGSRLALGRDCKLVRDCLEDVKVIDIDTSLFEALNIIAEHDYVLVAQTDKTICGIATASDFSLQFRLLAEPFLLIGEIENHIRHLIHGKYTVEELQDATADDDESVASVSDLTFGGYVRLLEHPDRWAKLKLNLDRAEFVRRLNKVREVRNDVMHFDPAGLGQEDTAMLRDFARFLQDLRVIGLF